MYIYIRDIKPKLTLLTRGLPIQENSTTTTTATTTATTTTTVLSLTGPCPSLKVSNNKIIIWMTN